MIVQIKMKAFFKKPLNIFIAVTSLSLILVSLSIAYYFIIVLPQKQKADITFQNQIKKLQQEVFDTKESIEDTQYRPNIDTTDIQDKLDQIQSAMEEQQWEEDKRTNCESNGGLYEGNGICCLTCSR